MKIQTQVSVLAAAIFTALVIPPTAYAQARSQVQDLQQTEDSRNDWSLGIGGVTSLSAYRGVDSKTTAFPFINYEGERFFVRGPSLGYRLTPDKPLRLAAFISAAPAEYDPDDSDDAQMRKLDRRNFTALAGFSVRYNLAAGLLTARVGTEITGRHHGQYAEVNYSYPFLFENSTISLTPTAGIEWHSGDFNDYYFGISDEEAARTTLTEYSPGSSTNPFLGLTLTWQFSEAASIFLSSRYKHFADEIADSPMLDDDSEVSSLIGLTWKF